MSGPGTALAAGVAATPGSDPLAALRLAAAGSPGRRGRLTGLRPDCNLATAAETRTAPGASLSASQCYGSSNSVTS